MIIFYPKLESWFKTGKEKKGKIDLMALDFQGEYCSKKMGDSCK